MATNTKTKKKKTEVIPVAPETPVERVETQQVTQIDTFIGQAIDKGMSVEAIEKFLAMREKLKAEHAREQFVKAMSAFQADCPVIEKTKVVLNKDGRTERYRYAPLDVIVAQVKKILAKHHLSYTIQTKVEDDLLTATATVTHIDGHSDSSSFSIPVSKSDFMTMPQSFASAQTFAKRYAFCNALGILTGDEDTDATDTESKEKTPLDIRSKIMLNLRTLGYETNERKVIEETVRKLTELELVEGNYETINERLEILVLEKNEDNSVSE